MRSGQQPTKMAGHRPLPSRKKANAIGFMKRQSKKSQSLRDVYEYEPSKARRSKVNLELDEDEAKGFGEFVDGEGNDDEARGVMHARLIGENDDDDGIASEDDEELDSDAAFEESDEERFAGFKFASERKKHHTSKPSKGASKVRFTDVDLNEDNEDPEEIQEVDVDADSGEEEDDDDPSEFIDVLDILDGKGEMDTGSDFGADTSTPRRATAQEDDVSEEEEDLPQPIPISDDEDDNMDTTTALDDLQKFVSKLDPSSKSAGKRKADGAASPKPAKRRQVIKERTEAGIENEFGAYSAGKLNIDDLLAPLAGSSSSSAAFTSLQKSAKVLRPDVPAKGKLDVESTKSKKPQTLSAPLPQRTQDRLDRQAAYEQTKGEVDKWSDSMKRIREAEHLSFPLQPEAKMTTSNLELASRFKPTTELETGISKLLQSARLREEDITETEDNVLKAQELSVEEVATRRAELRRMRELMYRAEVRARRIKKIKSKTYRRLRRKEKEKLDGGSGDGGEDEEEEAQLRREVERARERATLRHKNTGKWAKSMSGKHGLEQHQRLAIEEMLGRGEKLRRKIQGKGSDSERDEQSGDESSEEIGEEDAKARAFEELARLNDEDAAIDGGKGKGVFEMKFMKDAMIRQLVQADRERDDFIRELGLQGDDPSGDNDSAIARDEDVTVERTGGRIVFKPGAPPIRSNLRTVPASDTSSVTLKSTDLITPSPVELRPPTSNHSHSLLSHSKPTDDPSTINPWLDSHAESSLHAPRKRNEVVVSKTSAAAEKSKSKLKKQAKKLGDAKIQAREDAEIEISIDKFLGSAESARGDAVGSGSKRGDDDDDDKAHSEVEEQEKMLSMKQMKGKQKVSVAFEQRDLVALAFAGDNVVQQFDEVKRREMAADAPHEVDTTLPGWGSWGGTGSRKQAPKPHLIKKVAGIDPKTRADYGKSHVIISEKRDKKAAKYLVKDLPYPYTSKAQFERGMATPLGAEWNTRLGFQKGTLPKIVKKMGTVINPLEKLF